MRANSIKSAFITTTLAGLACVGLAAPASADHESASNLPKCEDSNFGLRDVVIMPDGSGYRTFYNGLVLIMELDTIEPAARSAGLAVLVTFIEEGRGYTECYAIGPMTSVDIDKAKSTYNPKDGLTLTIPNQTYGDYGAVPAKPIKLNINFATGTVKEM